MEIVGKGIRREVIAWR